MKGVVPTSNAIEIQASEELRNCRDVIPKERQKWIATLHLANTAFFALSAPLTINNSRDGWAKVLLSFSALLSAIAVLLGARSLYAPTDYYKREEKFWRKIADEHLKDFPTELTPSLFERFSLIVFPWTVFMAAILLACSVVVATDYSVIMPFSNSKTHAEISSDLSVATTTQTVLAALTNNAVNATQKRPACSPVESPAPNQTSIKASKMNKPKKEKTTNGN